MNNIEFVLKKIVNIILLVLGLYIIGKVFIFLLPILLLLIVGYYLYKVFLRAKVIENDVKSNKEKNIVDAEIINEKFDK